MRIAVLGAGAMGSAVARLLARHADVDLIVADLDEARVRSAVDAAGRGKAITIGSSPGALRDLLDDVDAVASCVPYRRNLEVMELALEAGCPYADLGGLFHMTLRQLELDERFREAGIPAVAGAGCCPGLSNVLAKLVQPSFDQIDSIDILDGAVEEGDEFGVPYSAETILDEFTRPAMVFEDGRLREVPAGSGAIRYRFPEPLGEMEAVYTLHSEPATLPRTIPGVRDVRWRLALPPAVADGFRLLIELGLASEEPVRTRSGTAVPREVLAAVLDRLGSDGPPRDIEVLVVRVRGTRAGRPASVRSDATFRPTPEGISAGAFGTASPMAVAARWLAEGRVPPGVHAPEDAFDARAFTDDLRREGVRIDVTEEDPAAD